MPDTAARPALADLLADLAAEGAEVDSVVSGLDADGWALPTPAPGWTVAHQVAHLAWTDDIALTAATDPVAFGRALQTAVADIDGYVDRAADELASQPTAELLETWRARRTALADALAAVPDGRKIPWFGPPMSPSSMATARLMETWAHGQDVADALGVTRQPAARLRHVAHIGVRTRDFAYLLRDRRPPAAPFRIELTAPDGELWTWGPDDAAQRVTGPALDFCMLVTQRRHPSDLAVRSTGSDAAEWLTFAQAFAGPPGAGRTPGQFA